MSTALTRREANVFACLIATVAAPGEDGLPPLGDTDALRAFATLLESSPAPNRLGLRALLLGLELGPLLRGYGSRLRGLPAARRAEFLGGFASGPLAGPVDAICAIAKLSYYGDDGVMRRLGYDPDAVLVRGRELRRSEARW